ncbi:MAG: TOBE domain-containing protein [Nocardioides sp.]
MSRWLLLLDEPMSALDVAVLVCGRRCADCSPDARPSWSPMTSSTLLLADRVVVVEGGEVVEEGPSGEVLTQPRGTFAARIAGLNLVRQAWRGGAVESASGLRIVGEAGESAPAEGEPAVAVFPPAAVSVFLTAPGGSPRNAVDVTVTALEPHGAHLRVRAGELSADVTPRAAAELDLVPGARATFVVKATEIAVYRL